MEMCFAYLNGEFGTMKSIYFPDENGWIYQMRQNKVAPKVFRRFLRNRLEF